LFVVLRFVPVSNRNKTLKPTKVQKDGKRKELSQFAQHTLATLGSGSMLQAVKLPKGEDVNEWLAVNSQISHRHSEDGRRRTRWLLRLMRHRACHACLARFAVL